MRRDRRLPGFRAASVGAMLLCLAAPATAQTAVPPEAWMANCLAGKGAVTRPPSVRSDNGRYCLRFIPNGGIAVWDDARKAALELKEHTRRVTKYTFAGDLLLTGASDGKARLWALDQGKVLRALQVEPPAQYVTAIVLFPGARKAGLGAEDGTFRVWDVESGKALERFTHDYMVASAAVSPDAATLAIGLFSGEIQTWNLATGKPLVRWKAHEREDEDGIDTGGIVRLEFSPDGRLLRSLGYMNMTETPVERWGIWEARTGSPQPVGAWPGR